MKASPERHALDQPEESFRADRGRDGNSARSVFGELLAYREVTESDASRLGASLANAETVARAFRGALLRHATDPPPAVLSGHDADGHRLERPHAAFLALPSSGGCGASGTIGGVAIAMPRDIEPRDREELHLALARWERSGARLVMGRVGAMALVRVSKHGASHTLDASRWTGPSREWASITPVALQHNPGDLRARDTATAARATRAAEQTVADACEHIGLPRPAEVRVMRRSEFGAVPPATAFMPYPRHGSGFKRVCVHVTLHFDDPVEGPVLLGVGRYFGVGVMRTVEGHVAIRDMEAAHAASAAHDRARIGCIAECAAMRAQPARPPRSGDGG